MTPEQQSAIELRKQGLTYPEISNALNGAVSVDWCKRNLKQIKKEDNDTLALEEVTKLALRPEGVTNYEIVGVLYSLYGQEKAEMIRKDKQWLTKLKKRVRTKNTKAVFRPAWIDPTNPLQSLRTMNQQAHELYENIQHLVDQFIEDNPNTNRSSAMKEMVKLANGWLLPEGLENRIERNQNVVDALIDNR